MQCKLLAYMTMCEAAVLNESQACNEIWWLCQDAVVDTCLLFYLFSSNLKARSCIRLSMCQLRVSCP